MSLEELSPIWPGIVADELNPQKDGEWYGAYDGSRLVGAAHLVQIGTEALFDDLWVRPDRRRTGVGGVLVAKMKELRQEMWLIADPDGVPYYERFGFRVEEGLPETIAKRYEALGLWPGHLDHLHVAMRWKRD